MKNITVPFIADPLLQRAFRALADGVNTLVGEALLVSLLPASVLSASSTLVEHRLGRTPRGFFVVRRSADIRVWETAEATQTTLTLRANVDGNVTLLVF